MHPTHPPCHPLSQAATGSSVASALGPFKKKCIILAVLETDGRTQATAALGRVVIDLAEFAAVENQETRTFQAGGGGQTGGAGFRAEGVAPSSNGTYLAIEPYKYQGEPCVPRPQ